MIDLLTEATTELDRIDGTLAPDFEWVRVGWCSAGHHLVTMSLWQSTAPITHRVPNDPIPIYERQLVWHNEVTMIDGPASRLTVSKMRGAPRLAQWITAAAAVGILIDLLVR